MTRKLLASTTCAFVLMAACGGGGGVDPEVWADDICSAAQDWISALVEGQSSLATPESPAEGREVLGGFLESAVEETESFISAVEDAGAPDVEEGEALADELNTALEKAKEVLEEALADVEGLSDDPEEFASQATELGASAQEALSSFGEGFSESEELATIFEENETCQQVGP